MWVLLRNSAFFLISFAVIALGLDQLLQRKFIFFNPNSNQSKVHRLLTSDDPREIPVFGSSKARSAFIPDTLGPSVFNYAMEKCNYDVIQFQLQAELAKPRKTPIIIEFNHRFFVHQPAHTINASTFVPNLNEPGVREFLKENDRLEPRYSIPGFRYYGSIFDFMHRGSRSKTGGNKQISKGGLFIDRAAPPQVMASQVQAHMDEIAQRLSLLERRKNVKEAVSVNEMHRLAGLDMLMLFSEPADRVSSFEAQLAQRPDRPILIVYTPQHASELAGIANFDRIEAKFKEWEERFPNVHVYDYSHVEFPDSDFKNIAHLNTAGARVFSGMLKHDAQQYLSNP